MSKPLEGKNALVTGASRGIGRSIALALAEAGANVAVNYAGSQAAAEVVAEEIRAKGVQAITIQANVGLMDEAEQMVKTTLDAWGTLIF